MKLIVPHLGEVHAADARLIRLAEFLGTRCELLPLDKQVRPSGAYLENAVPDRDSCFLVNPQVMRQWAGSDHLSAELVSCLVSHFSHLLVHPVTLDPFVAGMMASLSDGRLASVHPVEDAGQPYEIPADSKDVCGPFSGLSFGPINTTNDRVFGVKAANKTVRNLICIGGRPLMAALRRDATEILCIAGEDTADVDAHAGYAPLNHHFSRLMPQAMALRHIFGEECWHPHESHASIIVDDPLLRRNYGFLNFENLLDLMKKHNFHTTIGFIPHNYRRNSACILRMFRENARYFSICFHGNDHTQSEFASRDTDFLNGSLAIAEERMRLHHQATGLCCDRVMVFPQSDFSVEAMQVLKSRNFSGAVNSGPHPMGERIPLPLSDLCQPAVLRYGGFPLFLRNSAQDTRSQDVAFNLFFGRPTLFVEHHDAFKNPQYLIEAVKRVNTVAPGISWSSLGNALGRSLLTRRAPDGTVEIRAYSSSVVISNDSESAQRLSITWTHPDQCAPFEQVLRDGIPFPSLEIQQAATRLLADLAPGTSQTFAGIYQNPHEPLGNLGFRWETKAFLRRRLSEFRDNYLSKNRHVLTLARKLLHMASGS